jgi:hypothetical protein
MRLPSMVPLLRSTGGSAHSPWPAHHAAPTRLGGLAHARIVELASTPDAAVIGEGLGDAALLDLVGHEARVLMPIGSSRRSFSNW